MIQDYSLYRQEFLNDARNPRHFRRMTAADAVAESANPVCGDELTVFVRYRNAKSKTPVIAEVTFDGRGCMVMMASASRLLDQLSGKPLSWVNKLTAKKTLEIFGVPLTPSRQECALLPLGALRQLTIQGKKRGNN